MQDKICSHASRNTHRQAASLKYFLNRTIKKAVLKTWIATSTITLGLTGGLWLTVAAVPEIAQAETADVELTVDRRPNETYESLMRRAEAAAKATVAPSFSQNRAATDISITVLGRNQGAIAPVLSLNVNRGEQSSFNSQSSITYFSQARTLLRFDEDVATTPSNRQQNNRNSIRSRQPIRQQNNNSGGTNRQGVGTFSQPGRLLNPSTPGQPANNSGQSGSGNTTDTQPSGAGVNYQPQGTAPVNPTTQPQNYGQPTGTNSSPPVNAPNQPLNPSPQPGAGMVPSAPFNPGGSTSNQTPTNNSSPSNTIQNPNNPSQVDNDQYR